MKYKRFGFLQIIKNKTLFVNFETEETFLLSGRHRLVNELKRKLAAFMLQGQEASYIHHITILCDKKGIPVYKNEHDGLITGAEIPVEIVEEAGRLSGLRNPVLNIKPLASEDDLDKARRLTRKRPRHNTDTEARQALKSQPQPNEIGYIK